MKSPDIVPVIGKIIETNGGSLKEPRGTELAAHRDYPTMSKTRLISFTDEAQKCVDRAYEKGAADERQAIMMMMAACAEGAANANDRTSMRKLVSEMERRMGMVDV